MKWLRVVLVLTLFINGGPSWCKIRIPSILASGMVLQQQTIVNIWGWAAPGEVVTIKASWLVEDASAETGANGKWLIRIPTGKAGGPHKISLQGENTIVLTDILFGEVWVCAGQSNMEFTINNLGGWIFFGPGKKNLKKNDYAKIRLCRVNPATADLPADSCDVVWQHASMRTVSDFSAAAWFFGQCLYDWLEVPVGLISSSIGGTPAEAWTDRSYMAADPALHYYLSSPNGQHWEAGKASVLYNSMIHPLTNFRIKGAIWYQGESNIYDADLYGNLFRTMIVNWRQAWGQGDFPFYFVQIAPYAYKDSDVSAAYLREAQEKALSLPNTGMVVTMDIGDVIDIHPKKKQEVGERLALYALAKVYGKEQVFCAGPVVKKVTKEDNRFRISYDNAGSLVCRAGNPAGFAVAGPEGQFSPARAAIEGNVVIVSSDSIADPVFLRYAFNDTASVNLFNQAGLPAAPFRTDTLPLMVRDVVIDFITDSLTGLMYVKLSCLDSTCSVHYTMDGTEPDVASPVYRQRILLEKSATIRARAYREGLPSPLIREASYTRHLGIDKQIVITHPCSPKYKGGSNALLDGLQGSVRFNDRRWQGYHGVDFEGVIDLGTVQVIDSVSVTFLKNADSWIFLPVRVELSISVDGITFSRVSDQAPGELHSGPEPFIQRFTWKAAEDQHAGSNDSEPETTNKKTKSGIRYIRLFAKSTGHCPRGHPGAGEKAWLFLDEIIIR